MGRNFKILKSGKEQRLLDMLYGSHKDREQAMVIISREAFVYCSSIGRKMGFCHEETKDLLGDSMLAWLEALQEGKIEKNPVGYLKRIIKFKGIDKLNQKKKLNFSGHIRIEPSTVEDDAQKEASELTEIGVGKLLQAIHFLNPTYKKVIESYYLLCMSHKQIAVEQDTTPHVVKTQLSRARKILLDKLREL
jgi:RNA polymerase sigma factor (sigma-70 family)